MALSRDNVFIAKIILAKIKGWEGHFFDDADEAGEDSTSTILGLSKKSDGGWENIFINIVGVTPEQLALFEKRKKEVHNSSFILDKGNGITQIGWY